MGVIYEPTCLAYNSTMKTIVLLLLAAVLPVHPIPGLTDDAGSPPYSAEHDPAARAAMREQLITRLVEELDLRIEQQAVLGDIARDYGQRLAVLAKQGAEIGWSVLDVSPKNPQFAVDTEIAAQAAAEAAAQWVRTMTEFRNAVFSVLTREQIDLLEAKLQARRDAWQERMNSESDQ
jgi:Spy/CpxP family protein refolding chaperone